MTAPRPLGYWVKTVDRMIDEQFEAQADSAGISRREWQVLNRLRIGGVSDGSLEAALAPFLGEGESLEEALDRLRSTGWVEHRSGEHRLTDAGIAKVEEVQAASVEGIRDRLMDGLTEEDHEHLLRTLERMARNLGWEPT